MLCCYLEFKNICCCYSGVPYQLLITSKLEKKLIEDYTFMKEKLQVTAKFFVNMKNDDSELVF